MRSMERKMRDTKQVVELMLYGKWQTRKYTPPPVVAGIVPTNEHGAWNRRALRPRCMAYSCSAPCGCTGNVELWSAGFLPAGAAHIDLDRAATVAKQLGIHYADAVVRIRLVQHECQVCAPITHSRAP